MAWRKINDTKLTAIADAIRGKTGKSDALTLDQMPTEIAGIETGGGNSLELATITITGTEALEIIYYDENGKLQHLSSASPGTSIQSVVGGIVLFDWSVNAYKQQVSGIDMHYTVTSNSPTFGAFGGFVGMSAMTKYLGTIQDKVATIYAATD